MLEINDIENIGIKLKNLNRKSFERRYRHNIRCIVDWRNAKYIEKIDLIQLNKIEEIENLYTCWTKGESYFLNPLRKIKEVENIKNYDYYSNINIVITRIPAIYTKRGIAILDGNHRVLSIVNRKLNFLLFLDVCKAKRGFALANIDD